MLFGITRVDPIAQTFSPVHGLIGFKVAAALNSNYS